MNIRLSGTDPFAVTVALALLTAATSTARAELPPLIPREVLFGNPERVSPQISPDGKRLAWIAPNTNNVLQVWIKAKRTTESSRPIKSAASASTSGRKTARR